MTRRAKPIIVVGIDVGGSRKGFHAVKLVDGAYADKLESCEPRAVGKWCRDKKARIIGIDAPCRWSRDGRARPAERELMQEGIWCFSTPTRKIALKHPKNHYGWMLNGDALYDALESSHRLLTRTPVPAPQTVCFETFPHAVTCTLLRQIVSAKDKLEVRRELLARERIHLAERAGIDFVDAALCALTAHWMAIGKPIKAYGEPETGYIFVPTRDSRK